jgi:hypothetical protein
VEHAARPGLAGKPSADADNLRSALDWTRGHSDRANNIALAANSYRFWIQNQLPAELKRLGERGGALSAFEADLLTGFQ